LAAKKSEIVEKITWEQRTKKDVDNAAVSPSFMKQKFP